MPRCGAGIIFLDDGQFSIWDESKCLFLSLVYVEAIQHKLIFTFHSWALKVGLSSLGSSDTFFWWHLKAESSLMSSSIMCLLSCLVVAVDGFHHGLKI